MKKKYSVIVFRNQMSFPLKGYEPSFYIDNLKLDF